MAEEFGPTGHVDTFARDNLPPRADWPYSPRHWRTPPD